jgi:hypothetical protein
MIPQQAHEREQKEKNPRAAGTGIIDRHRYALSATTTSRR